MSEYLYRYIGLDKEYHLDVLRKNEFYFSSPKDFNDPFDCRFGLSFKNVSEYDLKEFIEYSFKFLKPNMGKEELEAKIDIAFRKYNENKYEFIKDVNTSLMGALEKGLRPLGILCFSSSPDDILMWSHYSCYHSGIVLRFSKEEILSYFPNCKDVTYEDDFPKVKEYNSAIKRNNDDIHKMFLLRKSDRWRYEGEWRAFIEPQKRQDYPGSRLVKFPKEMIKAVIYGCEMRDEDKLTIDKLHKEKLTEMVVYNAVRDVKSFGLRIEQISR